MERTLKTPNWGLAGVGCGVWGNPKSLHGSPCEYLAANNADMGLILFKDICF